MRFINTKLRISLGLVYVDDGVETINFRLEPSAGISCHRRRRVAVRRCARAWINTTNPEPAGREPGRGAWRRAF